MSLGKKTAVYIITAGGMHSCDGVFRCQCHFYFRKFQRI